MKNKPPSLLIIFSAILGVLLILFCFFAYQYLHDREIFYPYGLSSNFSNLTYYKIDPATILGDIGKGKVSIFNKLEIEPIDSVPKQQDIFFWNQTDYLQVADALHKFVWNQNVQNWKIYEMSFGRQCGDNPSGFSSGSVIFYRPSNSSTGYDTHFLDIIPNGLSTQAISGENNFRRPLLGWISIKPNKFKINADEALQLAEVNGGEKFRASVDNECSIVLVLNPNPENNGWLVGYYGTDNFRVRINPYTGSFEVINPN